jgi:hypothetical protein
LLDKKSQNVFYILCFTVLLFSYQNCSKAFDSNHNILSSSNLNSDSSANQTPDAPTANTPTTTTPTPNTPVPPIGGTPNNPSTTYTDVFLASGHMGRTIFSCDDGKTWIHDMSDNDSVRCWVDGDPNYVECDHTPNSGHGVDFGDGFFYANFGWGYNGSLRRSSDGVHWQIIKSNAWGGGVAYSQGSLYLDWGNGFLSNDQGLTWINNNMNPLQGFDHAKTYRTQDKIVSMGNANGSKTFALSADGGKNWQYPATLQVGWLRKVVHGAANQIVVIGVLETSNVGYSAVSLDDGLTWIIKQQGQGLDWNNLHYAKNKFVSWANDKFWQSSDGLNWTATNIIVDENVNKKLPYGISSYNPATGTFVFISNVWAGYYDKQKAYRSTDGIHWYELSTSNFKGGHPLNDIVLGKIETKYCK